MAGMITRKTQKDFTQHTWAKTRELI